MTAVSRQLKASTTQASSSASGMPMRCSAPASLRAGARPHTACGKWLSQSKRAITCQCRCGTMLPSAARLILVGRNCSISTRSMRHTSSMQRRRSGASRPRTRRHGGARSRDRRPGSRHPRRGSRARPRPARAARRRPASAQRAAGLGIGRGLEGDHWLPQADTAWRRAGSASAPGAGALPHHQRGASARSAGGHALGLGAQSSWRSASSTSARRLEGLAERRRAHRQRHAMRCRQAGQVPRGDLSRAAAQNTGIRRSRCRASPAAIRRRPSARCAPGRAAPPAACATRAARGRRQPGRGAR